jgi:aminotransferase in exopolysaccharide biosynthesis
VIPLSVPCIRGNAWKYVKECIDTEWVSSAGPFVDRFEEACRTFVGTRHAVACVSGTAALHVALQLVGVSDDDEVIVPTVTFIAPVNAIRYLHAQPVFMDCDEYYNLDVEKVLAFLDRETTQVDGRTVNRTTGRRIAAVLVVHVFGNAARLEPLAKACRERNLPLVEDSTESLGTRYTDGEYKGQHAGTIGAIGCFSFNGNKIITTGGGGMIVTNDDAHAARAKYLTTQAKDDEVRFVHGDVGYNYRLTNLQAALGVAQFEELADFLKAKRAIFDRYAAELDGIDGLTVAAVPPYATNNHWLCAVRVDAARYGRDRERLMADLAARKIQTRPLWHLNHQQKAYLTAQSYQIDRAPCQLAQTLTIPCSVSLTADQQADVISALRG